MLALIDSRTFCSFNTLGDGHLLAFLNVNHQNTSLDWKVLNGQQACQRKWQREEYGTLKSKRH